MINGQRIEAKLAGVEEYITYGTANEYPHGKCAGEKDLAGRICDAAETEGAG